LHRLTMRVSSGRSWAALTIGVDSLYESKLSTHVFVFTISNSISSACQS